MRSYSKASPGQRQRANARRVARAAYARLVRAHFKALCAYVDDRMARRHIKQTFGPLALKHLHD